MANGGVASVKQSRMQADKLLQLTLLVLVAGSASGTVIIDDGQYHSINTTISDDVRIENSSQVAISGNSTVFGSGPGSYRSGAVTLGASTVVPWTASTPRNELHVSGNARIIGASGQRGIVLNSGMHDVRLNGNSYVSSITATEPANWTPTSPQRLVLGDHASVGGNVAFSGFVSLSDQALISGNLAYEANSIGLAMNGGVIAGDVFLGGLDVHKVDVNGGLITQGIRTASSYVDFEMTGGQIGGVGMELIGQIDANIFGGRLDGGIRGGADLSYVTPDHFNIFGGQINAGSDAWLLDLNGRDPFGQRRFSTLDIRGGELGYDSVGNGIRISGLYNVDVYGSGLLFINDRLTGFLADGRHIDVALLFTPDWEGEFRIHDVSVPEPETMTLLSLGLIGLAFAHRRKLRGKRSA